MMSLCAVMGNGVHLTTPGTCLGGIAESMKLKSMSLQYWFVA